MRGAQFGVGGLQVHQVVEPFDQGAHGGLAAQQFEGRDGGGRFFAQFFFSQIGLQR